MAVSEQFKSASTFGKVAFVLLGIASVLTVVSFTCTGWGEEAYSGTHWGLWRRCGDKLDTRISIGFPTCIQLDGWANGTIPDVHTAKMGFIEAVKSTSIFVKISVLLLTVSLLFSSIAFTSTGWGEDSDGTHWGLWRICNNVNFPGASCAQIDGWANDWWAATQALVIFGFFGILVSFFLVILYIFVGKCQKNSEVAMAAGIICIVTGVLYLIGCIVFGAEWDKNYKDTNNTDFYLSYAFGLSIVALLLEIIAGVFLLLESKGKGVGQNPS